MALQSVTMACLRQREVILHVTTSATEIERKF